MSNPQPDWAYLKAARFLFPERVPTADEKISAFALARYIRANEKAPASKNLLVARRLYSEAIDSGSSSYADAGVYDNRPAVQFNLKILNEEYPEHAVPSLQ